MSNGLSIDDLAEKVSDRPIQGLLVSATEVWFPYSIEAVKLLKVGLILAVKNTASVHLEQMVDDDEDQHYSLLRIESVDTRHFIIDQIRQDRSNEPVSVEGLLEKHQKEWRRALKDPEENNLRIVVSFAETGRELDLPGAAAAVRGYDYKVAESAGRVMLGEIAYLVVREVVSSLVNRGMPEPSSENNVVDAGTHTLYRRPPLAVRLNSDDLFRRHFGIFGFTGAGKSNLLSTLVAKSLGSGGDEDESGDGANVVLLDVNNEYFGLLIDSIFDYDAHVVFVDGEFGDAMASFLDGDYSYLSRAAEEFLVTATLPKPLEEIRRNERGAQRLLGMTELLLAAGKFKRFLQTEEAMSLPVFVARIVEAADGLKGRLKGSGQGKKRDAWQRLVEMALEEIDTRDVNRNVRTQDVDSLMRFVSALVAYCADAVTEEAGPWATALAETVPKGGKEDFSREIGQVAGEFLGILQRLRKDLDIRPATGGHYVDLTGLLGALHDGKRSLVILLGSENSLRTFADRFGSILYDVRRRRGITSPTTVFVFDEADIYIPGQSAATGDDDKDAIKASKKIATTLSRRGRKYGLGIGIATQRIAYLDTSILAQLGTYFVGKLPRSSDRQRITEGFGIDQDSLQTGIQMVGDWVILSHTAVGDKGSPLPVHFDDANVRVRDFIESWDPDRYPELAARRRRFDYMSALVEQDAGVFRSVDNLEFLP